MKIDDGKARFSAILWIGTGLLFCVAMVFTWHRVPAGNRVFAVSFFLLGAVEIIYGSYRWYRIGRRSK